MKFVMEYKDQVCLFFITELKAHYNYNGQIFVKIQSEKAHARFLQSPVYVQLCTTKYSF